MDTSLDLSQLTISERRELTTDYYRYVYAEAISKVFDPLPHLYRRKANNTLSRLFISYATFGPQSPNDDLILPTTNSPYYAIFIDELGEGYKPIQDVPKYTQQIEQLLTAYHQNVSRYPLIKSISLGNMNLLVDGGRIPLGANLLARAQSVYQGPVAKRDYYLARLFLLYSIIGTSTGYQYALPLDITKAYDLELFASPFNFTLANYCSLFPVVDQYFGSKGKYPQCLDTSYP